jgi:uncharacterized protein YbjQ (UPF0145 family)
MQTCSSQDLVSECMHEAAQSRGADAVIGNDLSLAEFSEFVLVNCSQ